MAKAYWIFVSILIWVEYSVFKVFFNINRKEMKRDNNFFYNKITKIKGVNNKN